MHAYLMVGTDPKEINNQIQKLAKKLNLKILEFPFAKIEDVRFLSSFTSLELNEATGVVLRGAEETTTEAVNAFLKNLEEPQEKLYFILTTTSIHKLPPTIISRCQIIKVQSPGHKVQNEEVTAFFKMSLGKKLAYVDKIKDRKEAITFVENLIFIFHQKLHETDANYSALAGAANRATYTLNNIKANGNVSLQLANMVVNGV